MRMMTGVVLVGGKSSRMGSNKAFLKMPFGVGEVKSLVEIMVEKLKGAFEEVIVVAGFNDSTEDYAGLGVRVVKDILPDKNSLGGLYSGLVNSSCKYSFVVACDMPFMNMRLVEYMKNNCKGFDAVVPKLKSGHEALHSIYSKNCIGPVEKQLTQGNLKIRDLFPKIKVNEIKEETIREFDPELLSLFNINKADEYQQAVKITPSLCF